MCGQDPDRTASIGSTTAGDPFAPSTKHVRSGWVDSVAVSDRVLGRASPRLTTSCRLHGCPKQLGSGRPLTWVPPKCAVEILHQPPFRVVLRTVGSPSSFPSPMSVSHLLGFYPNAFRLFPSAIHSSGLLPCRTLALPQELPGSFNTRVYLVAPVLQWRRNFHASRLEYMALVGGISTRAWWQIFSGERGGRHSKAMDGGRHFAVNGGGWHSAVKSGGRLVQ